LRAQQYRDVRGSRETTVAHRVPIDPDKGIPDLVGQLATDSKQLLQHELRLAKLETKESIGRASRGGLWMIVAFAFLIVTAVAFTLFLATLMGRLANDNYWVGALVTGALEVVVGFLLVRRGLHDFAQALFSMPETRASITLADG